MKVTLERNALLKSLGHVHRVVERRNTYPILANVLMKAANGSLDLRATDLDIEVTESVPAMVATAGTTTVPAHTLYEIVRKLADGSEVRLETDGAEQMQITSGRSRFHLACLSPDSFPDLKSGAFSHQFTLPAATLRELIERTQFAISNEETRYYLNGIYVHTLEVDKVPMLRAVATDGAWAPRSIPRTNDTWTSAWSASACGLRPLRWRRSVCPPVIDRPLPQITRSGPVMSPSFTPRTRP